LATHDSTYIDNDLHVSIYFVTVITVPLQGN